MSEIITRYESAYGMVELTPETVTRYLARGNTALTEQEIRLFIELCKYQRLNPFIGEAYAIKFGQEFQMVVGYDTYKRRAEENPNYLGRKSGIVVLRGENVVTKEGTCLYPGEKLLGGWCRVIRLMNGKPVEEYKEVGLDEYDKHQANWKTKPCTMIEKVAVSQALRAAFPQDYTGLYTAEEGGSPDVTPQPTQRLRAAVVTENETPATDQPVLISKEQRKYLFEYAGKVYGEDSADKLREILASFELESTQTITAPVYEEILNIIEQDELARSGAEHE